MAKGKGALNQSHERFKSLSGMAWHRSLLAEARKLVAVLDDMKLHGSDGPVLDGPLPLPPEFEGQAPAQDAECSCVYHYETPGSTPLYYKRAPSGGSWLWSTDKVNWMDTSTLTVVGGAPHGGEQPTPPNLLFICRLELQQRLLAHAREAARLKAEAAESMALSMHLATALAEFRGRETPVQETSETEREMCFEP